MTVEELANDALYAGPDKVGYDIKWPRIRILGERIEQAIRTALNQERERIACLVQFRVVDIGCTATEAEGVVRRTRDALAKEIREGK